MERLCYSPTEEKLAEAEVLAEQWGIAVQIGDSQRTAGLDFDRDLVQVLQIPTEQHLILTERKVRVNQSVALQYVDEFSNVEGIRLEYTVAGVTQEVMPLWRKLPHLREYRIRFPTAGKCDIRIFDKDGTIATDVVEVVPW